MSGALANYAGNDTYVELYIDGVSAGHDDGDGGGSAGIQPRQLPSPTGPHSAYVVTVDDLGHREHGAFQHAAFTVDSVGPAAPVVTAPANGATITDFPAGR